MPGQLHRDEDFETEAFRLVEALRHGDRNAERQLYQGLYPIIRRVVQRKTRGTSLPTEDLIQTTLERVHVSLKNGSFTGNCSLLTWVNTVARSAIRDFRKKSSTELDGLELYAQLRCDTVDAERQLGARAELRALSARLRRMKRPYYNVVFGVGVLGMTVQEVASTTGATLAATQSRLRRAKAHLWRGRLLDQTSHVCGKYQNRPSER